MYRGVRPLRDRRLKIGQFAFGQVVSPAEVGFGGDVLSTGPERLALALAVAGDPALKEPIADEVADVLLYLLQIADHAGVDLAQAVENKLRKNAVKHPVPDGDSEQK